MRKCKMINCGKQLIGNEKYLCQSCKDNLKDKGKKTGQIGAGLLISLVALNKKFKK